MTVDAVRRVKWRTSFSDSKNGRERSFGELRRLGTRPGNSSPLTNFILATLRTSARRIRRLKSKKENNHGPPKVYTSSSSAV